MLTVDLSVPDPLWAGIAPNIDAFVAGALKAAWMATGSGRVAEVSVALADDRTVRKLNSQYRGKDQATNVLSFPANMPPSDGPLALGDIVVARETLLHEAEETHKTPADHLAHLLVHGLLHLLDYDHDTDAAAEVMEDMERQILKSLDIGDPYADNTAPQARA